MQERVLAYERKMADLEDRGRRCNVRVYGLPENIEKDAPIQYLERMIPIWFPSVTQPEVERAHRISRGGPPSEGERHRPFIFCCLRFSTRQAILREARKHSPSINNRVLRFAADFSDFTAKRRRSFSNAMTSARERGIDAFLIYPATLKIWQGQATHLFTSPADAERFLGNNGGDSASIERVWLLESLPALERTFVYGSWAPTARRRDAHLNNSRADGLLCAQVLLSGGFWETEFLVHSGDREDPCNYNHFS
ncbi:hypothetical protein GJAV_G00192110 [Gymnothorax javanicus]|nr:hypothetical protein GJAV_G00192110 [Gymnothorax javanicus]